MVNPSPVEIVQTRVETQLKTRVKAPNQLLALLDHQPTLTLAEAAKVLRKTPSTVERTAAKLRQQVVGPRKGRRWEVVMPSRHGVVSSMIICKRDELPGDPMVEKLTPVHALLAELVRRYWILGFECGVLEIRSPTWFLQRVMDTQSLPAELKLEFFPSNYGPCSNNLDHLLNALDRSYLQADKRPVRGSQLRFKLGDGLPCIYSR